MATNVEPGNENDQIRPVSPKVKITEESPRGSLHEVKLDKIAQQKANAQRAKNRWARLSRGDALGSMNPYQRKSTLRGSFMKMNRSGSLLAETTSQIKLENTYQMEPKTKPKLTEAKKMTREVLDASLEGEKYHHIDSKQLQLGITNEIKSRLREKRMVPDFYKIIVHTVLGQKYVCDEKKGIMSQVEVRNASRTLDMTDFDTHFSESYVNATMYCVVTVYMMTID